MMGGFWGSSLDRRHASPLFGLLLLFAASRLVSNITAPAPTLTWGCGEAAIAPAGVHLPAAPAFNFWGLAAQIAGLVLAVWLLPRLFTWLGTFGSWLLPDLPAGGSFPKPRAFGVFASRDLSRYLIGLSSRSRRGPPVAA